MLTTFFYIIKFLPVKFRRNLAETFWNRFLQRLLQRRARRARTLHEERLEGAGVTPDVPVAYPLPWTAGDDPLLRAGLLAAEAWCDELR